MADYLIHYNRNHNKKTGRFDFGDGDGDGIRNDHANQKKKESFEKKVQKAVKSYDKINKDIRKRTLETEQYKVDRDELRRQQAEIARATTASQTDEKRDKAELARYKQETKSEIRLRQLEEKRQKAQLEAERKAAKHQEDMIKRQMQAEKRAEKRQKLEERREQQAVKAQEKQQKAYEKAQRRAVANAKAEYKRQINMAKAQQRAYDRTEAKRSSMRAKALVAAVTGRPLTALAYAGGSTMAYPSSAAFVAKSMANPLGYFVGAPVTIAGNLGRNSYYKNK